MAEANAELVSTRTASARLGCSAKSLARWAKLGLAPAPIRIGRTLRWPSDIVTKVAARATGMANDEQQSVDRSGGEST